MDVERNSSSNSPVPFDGPLQRALVGAREEILQAVDPLTEQKEGHKEHKAAVWSRIDDIWNSLNSTLGASIDVLSFNKSEAQKSLSSHRTAAIVNMSHIQEAQKDELDRRLAQQAEELHAVMETQIGEVTRDSLSKSRAASMHAAVSVSKAQSKEAEAKQQLVREKQISAEHENLVNISHQEYCAACEAPSPMRLVHTKTKCSCSSRRLMYAHPLTQSLLFVFTLGRIYNPIMLSSLR